MRRYLYEEDEITVKESFSDSDVYTLDNLDLLNLPVEFTSTATSNIRLSRGGTQPTYVAERGDYLPYSGRCQRHSRSSRMPLGHKPFAERSDRSSIKSVTSSDQGEGADDKSLIYIYSNPDFDDKLLDSVYKHFLLPRHRRNALENQLSNKSVVANCSTETFIPKTKSSYVFPFKETPSGNLKVSSKQVAFQTSKLSVLIADPHNTSVNIENTKMSKNEDYLRNSAVNPVMNQGLSSSFGSLLVGKLTDAPVRKEQESSEYEGKATHEILDPELDLNRLGYTSGHALSWSKIKLPEKRNLYLELYTRITNFTNADCIVFIGNEEFNCHLIVLQCYSEVFHAYVAVKKVELPPDKCSPVTFAFIYEWMITGDPSYRELNRDNVLDIFRAAKYLKIKDLIEQCWAFIDNEDIFSEDTAFLLYVDSRVKNLPEVKQVMLPRIQKFFLMLVSSQDWLELDLEDVQNFLQSNYVRVNCEMEIFMSAVRWLKYDWEQREQFKVILFNAVRFGNIAPWQLVDIKRNPDNPEYTELARDPDISKMIDDGLAYVIIKYWYGQENDDYQHWNSILALEEPAQRNWSGMEKTYFTYRDFLIYLDQYRRNQIVERSKSKNETRAMLMDTCNPKSSSEWLSPKIATMHDNFNTRKIQYYGKGTRFGSMSKSEAAIKIQAAYRGYATRSYLKKYLPKQKKKREVNYPVSKYGRGGKIFRFDEHYKPDIEFFQKPNQRVLSMFVTGLDKCKAYSQSAINRISALAPRQPHYFQESSLFLHERESVMVFGGIDPHSGYGVGRNTGKDIFRYLPDTNVWEYVGEMPAPRNHHNVAFLIGRVYVVGGSDPREDEFRGKSVVVDTVWSFDPMKRNWFSEGSLNFRRKNFGLVVSRQSMYAIGGQDKYGRTLTSVEKYNTVTGVWEFQAPMLYPRMGVACAKHNDKIWAAGGMSGSRRTPLTDYVECYDINRNQWTEVQRLRFPRCFAALFSMSNRLYLIGGAGKIKDRDRTTSSVKEVDVWNEDMMRWESRTEMAIPRHGHCVAYLGTQILIIGGVTTVYMRALSNTECYCTNRGTWVRGIACLPTTLSGHATVTLPPAILM